MLSRYDFEVLVFMERMQGKRYTYREMVDSLTISGTQVSRSVERLTAAGNIEKKAGRFLVTDKGYAELEPYRVKHAVILAAGFGSRMMPATADRPKPMVTVNGKRIIETLLDAFVSAGIRDITIVRGYKKESFQGLLSRYPFLRFIDNDDFDKTNNISSAIAASEYFHGGCYLCEADLYITNPNVIIKYQYTSNILGSFSMETDDWSFRMKDGFICDYQKGNTNCWNYYGVSYWTPEDCEKLNQDWKEIFQTKEGKNVFWEIVPLQLRKQSYHVEIRQCRKQDIMEIDNYYELAELDPSYRE